MEEKGGGIAGMQSNRGLPCPLTHRMGTAERECSSSLEGRGSWAT